MELEGNAMEERIPGAEDARIVFNCESLRIKDVVQEWESIKSGYLAYTDKVNTSEFESYKIYSPSL